MSGVTDRAGQNFGVSLRELAQDLGIPNPWRKWTLDGWVEEMARLAGDPDVHHVNLGPVDGARVTGQTLHDVLLRPTPRSIVILVRTHRPTPWQRTYPDRIPVVPVVAYGLNFPAVMVLLHELLSSRGVDCPEMAALATRLLVEGTVRTLPVVPLAGQAGSAVDVGGLL